MNFTSYINLNAGFLSVRVWSSPTSTFAKFVRRNIGVKTSQTNVGKSIGNDQQICQQN